MNEDDSVRQSELPKEYDVNKMARQHLNLIGGHVYFTGGLKQSVFSFLRVN